MEWGEALRMLARNLIGLPLSWQANWTGGSSQSVKFDLMIRSFRDPQAERLFRRESVKRLDRVLQRVALRKLVMLDAAEALEALAEKGPAYARYPRDEAHAPAGKAD